MAKNANIRFENANVAYVSVDTDTHELTGGVMDETTGIFYPVGGGGGGIENPILTLNIDASDVLGDQGWISYLTITENNILKNISGISIIGGETYEFNILVPAWDNGDDPDVFVWNNTSANGGFVGTTKVITASNEINCMAVVDQENGSLYIMVTDPSSPASATLTVTNS